MFDLYAVQAAPSAESPVTFEKEDGYTEALHLGTAATAFMALASLIQADEDKTTRATWEDAAVKPPLWGHEVYQRREPGDAGKPRCVARASSGVLTLTSQFTHSAIGTDRLPHGEGISLPARWT